LGPQWALFATSAHACAGYYHSRLYFLIPAKTPYLAIRPDNISGAVSEEAKRKQRGSKEEAMRRTEAETLDFIGFDRQKRRFSRRIYQLSLILPKSVPGFRGQRHIFCITWAGTIYFWFVSGSQRSFRLRLPAPGRAADKKQQPFLKIK
jgi:hypothetical protein